MEPSDGPRSAPPRERAAVEVLRRIAAAVGRVELDELLRLIVDATTDVLAADRATVYLREGDQWVARIKRGGEDVAITLRTGQGLAGHVAATGDPLRVDDVYADPRFDETWDDMSEYRTETMLAVPLFDPRDEVVGVLQVLNKQDPEGRLRAVPFEARDVALLEALAVQAAVAVDMAGLVGELRANMEQLETTKRRLERSYRDLELLYELETSMSRAESVDQLARSVVTLAGRACGAEAGALLHVTEEEHVLYAVNLDTPHEVRRVVVQPGEGVAARAARRSTVLHLDSPRRIRDPRRVRELLGITPRHALAAPLGDRTSVTGALVLYNHDEGPFRNADRALLKLVTANVQTELRYLAARRRRERAERLGEIGRLLSGIMHDLRTPLTVINGYLQLMEVAEEPEERATYAMTVREQFDIIAGMQRDIIAYARGETDLLVRKVYLDHFIERTARAFAPEADGKQIELVTEVGFKGTAFFDERRMSRALGNLIRNAFEAVEGDGRRGRVKLVCRRRGQDLIFVVRDNGPGIPAAIRGTMFEPFVTQGKKTGTGLGLANVRELVEEHGGRVDVRSSRRGTTFELVLPEGLVAPGLRGGAPPRSQRLPVVGPEGKG
ncbi:MAG: GAF domain-containing protein [Myxococcota bacterium]